MPCFLGGEPFFRCLQPTEHTSKITWHYLCFNQKIRNKDENKMNSTMTLTQIHKNFIRKPIDLTAHITWVMWASIVLWVFLIPHPAFANIFIAEPSSKHLDIPILGVTLNNHGHPMGVVVHVEMEFEERQDYRGLQVLFHAHPGNFSPWSQHAVRQAILLGAHEAGLHPSSWTVNLAFPYTGVTMYGDSLSAMVGLSVVALAKGDSLPLDRVLTGTITSEGKIGPVGGVPFKIYAAHAGHFQRVLIPEERAVTDGDWQTPFLMQVSPVGTVSKAYFALTGHPLHSPHIQRSPVIARLP